MSIFPLVGGIAGILSILLGISFVRKPGRPMKIMGIYFVIVGIAALGLAILARG
ncbi:MAG: hypothetical protein HYX90_04315 [Chloroflexi bacterium]|nr:hypothetical protein [Chloroflexota bacterium]